MHVCTSHLYSLQSSHLSQVSLFHHTFGAITPVLSHFISPKTQSSVFNGHLSAAQRNTQKVVFNFIYVSENNFINIITYSRCQKYDHYEAPC